MIWKMSEGVARSDLFGLAENVSGISDERERSDRGAEMC